MKHPRKNVEKNQTRISTSKTETLRLVESRHFPTFFSFVSIDPESAILLIVPSSCNSIGFREHIKTIENKTLLFPLQCSEQVFFLHISRPFRRIREKNNSNRSQFTTNSRKIKFLIETKKKLTQTHVHTRNGRLTPKATSTNESILRARKQNGFIFFVLSFTIWESRNKRKLKNKCTHGNNAIFWMKM